MLADHILRRQWLDCNHAIGIDAKRKCILRILHPREMKVGDADGRNCRINPLDFDSSIDRRSRSETERVIRSTVSIPAAVVAHCGDVIAGHNGADSDHFPVGGDRIAAV